MVGHRHRVREEPADGGGMKPFDVIEFDEAVDDEFPICRALHGVLAEEVMAG
jgi:hypothetical protein